MTDIHRQKTRLSSFEGSKGVPGPVILLPIPSDPSLAGCENDIQLKKSIFIGSPIQ